MEGGGFYDRLMRNDIAGRNQSDAADFTRISSRSRGRFPLSRCVPSMESEKRGDKREEQQNAPPGFFPVKIPTSHRTFVPWAFGQDPNNSPHTKSIHASGRTRPFPLVVFSGQEERKQGESKH